MSLFKLLPRVLAELREEAGIRHQKDAAARLGIDKSTFNRYEKGSQDIPLEALERMLALYRCSLSELENRLLLHARKRSRLRDALDEHGQRIAAIEQALSVLGAELDSAALSAFANEEGREP